MVSGPRTDNCQYGKYEVVLAEVTFRELSVPIKSRDPETLKPLRKGGLDSLHKDK